MRTYKNLSQRSGVKAYEYDLRGFSWITVEFLDNSVYSYTIDTCGLTNVLEMITLAEMGRGLNRHINFYEPAYINGRVTAANTPTPSDVKVKQYPSLTVKSVKWDDAEPPQWFRIEYKDGHSSSYTVESCGRQTLDKLIELAQKGYGLLAFINKEKPEKV